MEVKETIDIMSRAEIRRKQRESQKVNTATYNLTKAQLDALVEQQIGDRMKQVKEQATYDAVNTAMVLLLTLPLEVLMDHYWQKSYEKKIPEFTAYVLEYYQKWQDGELDMDEMKEDLWNYAGFRLEESEG